MHGVRALALENNLPQSNTFERLVVLADKELLESQLAHDAAEALGFLLHMRLKAGLDALAHGRKPNNLIAPDKLSTLDRDLLKDALAVVKRFKVAMRHHFKISGF